MKRSEINSLIEETKEFLRMNHFHLPPFAFWTPEQWAVIGHEADEIRDNLLGWDITDFGLGDFHKTGLICFTIRNGNFNNPKYQKPYSEKVLIIEEDQVTPMHFHWSKMEDIIVRNGGNLLMQLYNSDKNKEMIDTPVIVTIDGIRRILKAGEVVWLIPGESITITQGLYHKFWAEEGKGKVLAGEVSMVNDDEKDNFFYGGIGRFPEIEEDETPIHFLAWEYPPCGI